MVQKGMEEQITQQETLKQEVKLDVKQPKPVKMALKRTIGVIVLLVFIAVVGLMVSNGDTQIHTNGAGFAQLEETVDKGKSANKKRPKVEKKNKRNNLNSRRKHYLTKFD